MPRFLLLASAVLPAAWALGAAPSFAAQPILPGYWESTNAVTFPIPDKKTERKCITPAQIESYITGPVNGHYSCHYDETRFAEGHASMRGECVDKNGLHSKIKVTGDYTPTSFHMDGVLQVVIGGLLIPVQASTDAHRLSDECPADAPK